MKTLVWLLALALPIQNLAVVALQLRGPAHIHADASSEHGPHPGHPHDQVEHHYHGANQGAIEVDDDDDDHHHEPQAPESNKRVTFSSFDALTLALLPAVVQPVSGAIAAAVVREPPPPFPGRLERPPTPPAAWFFR
jgi:hypothetical protein